MVNQEWVYTAAKALYLLGGKSHSDEIADKCEELGEQNQQEDIAATVRDALQRFSADSSKGRRKGILRGSPLDVFKFAPKARTSIFEFSSNSNPILKFIIGEMEGEDLKEELRITPQASKRLIEAIDDEKTVRVREHMRRPPLHDNLSDPLFHMISDGPRPVAPFSHAVETDGFVFVTGQMPTDPKAPDAALPHGIEAQTKRVVENLQIVLAGIDLDLSHIVMARIYLTEFYRDYEKMNKTWRGYFPVDRRPARTTIGVTGLALHALVEIDLVAKRPQD